MPRIQLVMDANKRVIGLGDDTVETARQRALAEAAAERAEAAANVSGYFSTVAGGAAATTAPATFLSDEGGSFNIYDADGALLFPVDAGLRSYLATTAGGDAIGLTDGDTVQDKFDGLADTSKGEGAANVATEFGTVEERLYRAHNYAPKVNPPKIATAGGKCVVKSNSRKPKLVILLGQSNAEGRATSFDANQSNDITGTRASVQIWNGSAFEDLLVPNLSNVTGNNDAQSGRHGIELALANFVEAESIQTTTAETAIHMVKVTEGGTFMGQWLASADIIAWDGVDPDDPDDDGNLSLASPGPGVLDSEANTAVTNASSAMDTLYGAGNWEPVLVMIQGEANGGSPTQLPRFKRQRKTFNARWRARLGASLRIIQPHILARNEEYIKINSLLNEIEYEDPWSYVLANTAYLSTNDDIHLDYFGMAQMGSAVAREIYNPTTKIINRPKLYQRDIAGAATLPLVDTDDVVYLTGTTTIDRAPLNSYWDGRRLIFLRTQAGAGISIRHESGSASTHTLFRTLTAATVAMSATGVQRREFIGVAGYFQEVPV